jgi:hypothetical protein
MKKEDKAKYVPEMKLHRAPGGKASDMSVIPIREEESDKSTPCGPCSLKHY